MKGDAAICLCQLNRMTSSHATCSPRTHTNATRTQLWCMMSLFACRKVAHNAMLTHIHLHTNYSRHCKMQGIQLPHYSYYKGTVLVSLYHSNNVCTFPYKLCETTAEKVTDFSAWSTAHLGPVRFQCAVTGKNVFFDRAFGSPALRLPGSSGP